MRLSTVRRTDVQDELAFHRARFREEVGGIREVGDMIQARDGVEGRLWDAGAETALFFWIRGP